MKSRVKFSPNKEIGILPPGPIDNQVFYDSQGEVKQELELNKDYRGVNIDVWKSLSKIYQGGPLVVRSEMDIYSKDLKEHFQKLQLKNSSSPLNIVKRRNLRENSVNNRLISQSSLLLKKSSGQIV